VIVWVIDLEGETWALLSQVGYDSSWLCYAILFYKYLLVMDI